MHGKLRTHWAIGICQYCPNGAHIWQWQKRLTDWLAAGVGIVARRILLSCLVAEGSANQLPLGTSSP